jgi:hypothetical protein
MAVGGPGTRPLTGPVSPWQLGGRSAFGVQPSGPVSKTRRVLPSPEKLDYAHKLTSTTMLVAAAVGFLVFGPKSLRGKVKAVSRKHVGSTR